MNNRLYIVVPCYKEEAVLPETSRRLREKLEALIKQGKIDRDSRILFVNDGSKDRTWPLIEQYHKEAPEIFSGINLSRNRGHQNALLAGLSTAVTRADMVISMDADLQDDINAVDAMIDEYHNGYDIVYGVRSKRETDTFFKRFTAEGFYKIMQALGVDIVFNHADYRLMSKRAVEAIRLVFFAGVFIFLCSLVMFIYAIITKAAGRSTSGWSSLMASIWMLGGIQLLGLGIVGEYIGKIYNETKRRPRFIIEQILDTNDAEQEK